MQAEPSYLKLPLTSQWYQDAPYFNQLPVLTPGTAEHTLVGCNATATAQIMYYWKWPPSGTGSWCIDYNYWQSKTAWASEALANAVTIPPAYNGRLRYNSTSHELQINGYWDESIYLAAQGISKEDDKYLAALARLWNNRMSPTTIPVCANFGATTYKWSIMRDTNTEPPDTAGDEAAKVSAHTAIAVHSNLGVWNTGSSFGHDVIGLTSYFRYDFDALYTKAPSDHGPGADITSLTTEITWGRVAGLGGTSADGKAGHAWVIDGYDNTGAELLLHMNMGRQDLNSQGGWYTFDSGPDSGPYPTNHDMMTMVAPLTVKFAEAAAARSGDGSPKTPYQNITQAVTAIPANDTLMLRAGSEYNFSGTLVINRAMTLMGYGAVIR